jgi:SNF2-related domain
MLRIRGVINLCPPRDSHILPGKIRYLTYHGSKRQEVSGNMHSYDIVLTTYETLRSSFIGESPVFEEEWARVILDEGICSSAPDPVLHTMHAKSKFL